MASKAKATKKELKNEKVRRPVLARAKDSAREQIDHFLLGIQHSSLAKFSAKLKAADTSDLLMMVGRKVLEQAAAVRATLPANSQQVIERAKKPFRAAARVATPLKSKAKSARAATARPLKKATSKKKK